MPFQSGILRQGAQTFCLLEAAAQRPAPVRLAIDAARRLGTGLLPAQTGRKGKTHSMAVRALANVWVRIIYRMWVSKTSYQTATFEAAKLAPMRPGNTSPESRPRLPVAPLGWLTALRGPSPSAGRGCPNGVAQSVPATSFLPTVSRAHCSCCRSNVCRSPPPRSRLPVWVAGTRPRRVKADRGQPPPSTRPLASVRSSWP